MARYKRTIVGVPFILKWESEGIEQTMSVTLAYDLNALGLVEDKLGLTPTVDIEKIFFSSQWNVRSTQALLWAALQLNHSDDFGGEEGYKAVGSILTLQNVGPAKDACWDAYLGQLSKENAAKFRAAIKALTEPTSAEATPTAEPGE